MHAGQQTDMKRGAIWACVIPVTIGVIGLVFFLFNLLSRPVSNGAMAITANDSWAFLPIVACFIFGAPLSAWLACRGLRKIDAANKLSLWRSSAIRGFLSASLVHGVSALLYTIGVYVVIHTDDYVSFQETNTDFNLMTSLFFGSAFMNLVVWIIITLPLSLLCATIFWKVTKFPKDTSVF